MNACIGRKILILGCSGSGKSTLAGKLQKLTGLPLYHLDNIWWKPDMTNISREEFDKQLDMILREDEWIIDGDYSRTIERRLAVCDTVFFFDYSEEECMAGITERVGTKRPDIPFVETTLDPELVEMVRSYSSTKRPVVYELFRKYNDKQIIIFRSRLESDEWLRGQSELQN